MGIRKNIEDIRSRLPAYVRLIAVSKTQPPEAVREAYEAGQRLFGENRAQEAAAKAGQLPADIEWHFIGHLQTNKVKYLLPFISMIQSIDSEHLLAEVNRQAAKTGIVIPCLLQFHIAREESKSGFSETEAMELFSSGRHLEYKNISLNGVMGMASLTDDAARIRSEFRNLREIFNRVKSGYFSNIESFCEISMGMSDDYPLAVEEGSTLIRIGTAIFGPRQR